MDWYKYLEKTVWKNYEHVIFLSGTILNSTLFAFMNGLDPKNSSYYEVDSSFPVENRPIYYIKAGKMTYNEKVNGQTRKLFSKKTLSGLN